MLTRIRLVNLQKHKNLTLNFGKINVITGATDTGKTSVLRGLLWGLTNNEAGDNLINNDGAKSCSVLITVDGHEVERSWTKSKNAYRLDDKEFTTFRTTVPSPIATLLNMTELNIQARRDLPFMVYYKASECANQFSQMLDLDEIDSTIANVNKAVKQKTEEVACIEQQIKSYDIELEKYADLDGAQSGLERLESLEAEIKALDDRLQVLSLLYSQVRAAKKIFEALTDPSKALDDMQAIMTTIDTYKQTNSRLAELQDLYDEMTKAVNTADRLACADLAMRDYHKMIELRNKSKDVRERYERLDALLVNYCKIKEVVLNTDTAYTIAQKQFVDAFPDVCPLCGGVPHVL